MKKVRLDLLLVERGLAESREKAQRLIRAGRVRHGDQPMTKPGHLVDGQAEFTVTEKERYVSRGGHKLEAALARFSVEPDGKDCIDVGSSTGGFTDCLLQHGAANVVAVDVGKGQLHWDLRRDERVHVMEQYNARELTPDALPYRPTLAVVDVSFISLTKILPALAGALEPGSDILTLIKPQFEAGPEKVARGVVRDAAVHADVIETIRLFGTSRLGLVWHGHMESPLKGPAGNTEFLAHWTSP